MKTIIELMTEQFQKAFEECGYSKDYARITVSSSKRSIYQSRL